MSKIQSRTRSSNKMKKKSWEGYKDSRLILERAAVDYYVKDAKLRKYCSLYQLNAVSLTVSALLYTPKMTCDPQLYKLKTEAAESLSNLMEVKNKLTQKEGFSSQLVRSVVSPILCRAMISNEEEE